ncbi:tetratricopeptide repeat protein [Acidobacteria bacterium AB60]|nr:tetratricopeptide repeat protein [Acidobacteria bacterium AB60]
MFTYKFPLVCTLACAIGASLAASSQTPGTKEAEHYAIAGQQALAEGQYFNARDDFEQVAKLQPNVAEAHATLAVIYFKLREYEHAADEARKAQKLNPGLPRLTSLLGLSLAELGQYSEALPRLEKGFKYTAEPEVRRMCGLQLLRAYSGMGRNADAVTTSLELNKLYPEDAEVLYHTSRVFGAYAYTVMAKLEDKAPNSSWSLQAQGEAAEGQRDFSAAIAAYEHAVQQEPDQAGLHFKLGHAYLSRYQQGRKPEDRDAARRQFLAELNVDPDNGNASYELAQMSADDNDLEGAQRQFEAVVARFPEFEQALVGLAGVYLKNRLAGRALAPLEHATKLDAHDEVAWYRLAQAERAAGNREAAQRALETFRSLHGTSEPGPRLSASTELTLQQLGPDAQP